MSYTLSICIFVKIKRKKQIKELEKCRMPGEKKRTIEKCKLITEQEILLS